MSSSIKISRLFNILLSIALLIFFYCPRAVKTKSFTLANGAIVKSEYLTFAWWAGIWAFIAIGCIVIIFLLSLSKFYHLTPIAAGIALLCVAIPTFTINSSSVSVFEEFFFYGNLFFACILFANCLFQSISKSKNNNQQANIKSLSTSADELKKYKDLLDNGVISQEEFDAKKKQLLGL